MAAALMPAPVPLLPSCLYCPWDKSYTLQCLAAVTTWLWGCREEADLAPCLARLQLSRTVLLSVSMAAS